MKALRTSPGISSLRGHPTRHPTKKYFVPLPLPSSERSVSPTPFHDGYRDMHGSTPAGKRRMELGEASAQDISVYSDDAADSAAEELWYRLSQHRKNTSRFWGQSTDRRRELKALRYTCAERDNAFLSLVRDYAFRSGDETLIKRYNELQDVRAVYRKAETELEALEDMLQKEEVRREDAEFQFFRHIYYGPTGPTSYRGIDADASSLSSSSSIVSAEGGNRPASRTSLLGIPDERPFELHPLHERLNDQIGVMDAAQEELDELVKEREMILNELCFRVILGKKRGFEGSIDPVFTKEELEALKAEMEDTSNIDAFLTKHGLKMGEGEEEALKEFDERTQKANNQLEKARSEARRLRSLCVEQGVKLRYRTLNDEYAILKAFGEPTNQLSFGKEIILDDGHAGQGVQAVSPVVTADPGANLRHPQFSILLSNPKHVLQVKTVRGALKEATKQPRTPENLHRKEECIAELSIESSISNTKLGEDGSLDKSDFVNRWLLQQLRTSSLQVLMLLGIFERTLRVRLANYDGWQRDVLQNWERDEAANLDPRIFDGPITGRDSCLNSVADMRASDAGSPRDLQGVGDWTSA